MNKSNIFLRYLLFLVGLFIASLGVAFTIKAGLGTSPVSSIPYSVSLISDIFKFGGWQNLWSLVHITVEIALLRKKCKPLEIIIQTILAFVYGYLANFSVSLIEGITVNNYFEQILYLLIGCVVLAFGIWLQFKGGVAMLPGEAMNRAISQVTGKRYENVKIFFDVFYIATAVVINLIAHGKLLGVREGSIISAVIIGMIIKGYNWIFDKIFNALKSKKQH